MDIVDRSMYNENARVCYSEEHRWYYYDGLQADEIIVFRQSDSNFSGGGGKYSPEIVEFLRELTLQVGVPHTGFLHPNPPENVSPRESIETRAFIYYK
jgi:hypothetical protein